MILFPEMNQTTPQTNASRYPDPSLLPMPWHTVCPCHYTLLGAKSGLIGSESHEDCPPPYYEERIAERRRLEDHSGAASKRARGYVSSIASVSVTRESPGLGTERETERSATDIEGITIETRVKEQPLFKAKAAWNTPDFVRRGLFPYSRYLLSTKEWKAAVFVAQNDGIVTALLGNKRCCFCHASDMQCLIPTAPCDGVPSCSSCVARDYLCTFMKPPHIGSSSLLQFAEEIPDTPVPPEKVGASDLKTASRKRKRLGALPSTPSTPSTHQAITSSMEAPALNPNSKRTPLLKPGRSSQKHLFVDVPVESRLAEYFKERALFPCPQRGMIFWPSLTEATKALKGGLLKDFASEDSPQPGGHFVAADVSISRAYECLTVDSEAQDVIIAAASKVPSAGTDVNPDKFSEAASQPEDIITPAHSFEFLVYDPDTSSSNEDHYWKAVDDDDEIQILS